MRAPWTIQQYRWADRTTGRDTRNNPTTTWGAPVDRAAYGWGAPSANEPVSGSTSTLVVEKELLAPTFPIDHRDELVVEGQRYMVVGDPGDFDHGPFGTRLGMVVKLRRVA